MSLLARAAKFASSPQGRRLANQAKAWAADPKNRQKIEDARRRLAQKRA